MDEIGVDKLVAGDWILWKFGFNQIVFYVVKNYPTIECIFLNRTQWCLSAAMPVNYKELKREGFALLGHTKKKWWFNVFAFTDLCHPFKKISLV